LVQRYAFSGYFGLTGGGIRARADGIYTLKITGLKMNPPTWTVSGDPMQGNGVAAK